MRRVLVVDDDPIMVNSIVERFELEEFSAIGTSDIENILSLIEKKQPDVVILDVYWGNPNKPMGIDVLKEIRKRWNMHSLPVLMMSALSQQPDHDESMDNGANYFFAKPFKGSDMVEKVQRILDSPDGSDSDTDEQWSEHIVGASPAMINLASQIYRYAQSRRSVLFLGETGTGKDLAARMYYQRSRWCDKPFKNIYATDLNKDIMESWLFGQTKGAHSTANEDKMGLVEAASGGILLLNEIGDLPLDQQSKLLNLIENKTILPLGASEPIKVDIVILTATNRDINKMISKGQFRPDLYQRLSESQIEIPPLREHLEDIPLLVEHFRKEYNQEAKTIIREVEREVVEYFQTLTWERNVRQLRQCIQDAALKCLGGKIVLRDVEGFIEREKIRPLGIKEEECPDIPDFDMDFHTFSEKVLKGYKREYVEYHLNQHNRHVPTTAKAIGIQRQQLNGMMRTLGINNKKE